MRLSLWGTLLACESRRWGRKSTTLTPVEWIEIGRDRRFDLRPLYVGLTVFVGSLIFAVVAILLSGELDIDLLWQTGVAAPLAAFLFCIVCAGRVFFRRDVVRLTVAAGPDIDFWRDRANSTAIDAFLGNLQHAKETVEHPLPRFSDQASRIPPPPRSAILPLICILSAPALIFEKPVLFLLVAAVVPYYARMKLAAPARPRGYYRALAHFWRGRHALAERLLEALLKTNPDCEEAWTLLVWVRFRQSRFDDARRTYTRIPGIDDQTRNEIGLDIWIGKRIFARARDAGVAGR